LNRINSSAKFHRFLSTLIFLISLGALSLHLPTQESAFLEKVQTELVEKNDSPPSRKVFNFQATFLTPSPSLSFTWLQTSFPNILKLKYQKIKSQHRNYLEQSHFLLLTSRHEAKNNQAFHLDQDEHPLI
jgi:hypothetical protein